MLTVIARLQVQPGKEATFEAEAAKMVEHVQANEPGTTVYRCYRSQADPTTYVFYEQYTDQAAFGAHGTSEAMQHFFGAMGGILAGRPQIEMFDEVGGKR
ncbi:MAG: antibiotic biosynthesis monooxygenase [bacterium]|nr:antibiotic biosynthesis monooxygenase [bacterium]